ncbi:carboxypeptidase-like regulatory domain-containing protein [Ekhidna sp.]|uniref:carboxypeptidase-like regulatory domain-containing protein n=1 Tax=Ekhidna sp. TaxID=2608089 RepID=UPI003512FDDF
MKKHSVSTFVILLCALLLSSNHAKAQNSKTKLLITVLDVSGKLVEGATVSIYSSEEDYQSRTNKLIEGKTDKKGRFQYKGLDTKPYFLDIKKDNLKNSEQSANTGVLSEERFNKFLITIK